MYNSRSPAIRLLTVGLWLIVAFLFWWVGRDLDLVALGRTLTRLTIMQVSTLLAVNAAIIFVFTVRWWWILRAQGYDRPFLHLALYRLTAFGINYFTPGPQFGGEPFQVYALHRREGVPFAVSVSSVTLDKLAELLANFGFLLIGVVTILRFGLFPAFGRIPIFPLVVCLLAIPVVYLAVLWSGRHPLASGSRYLVRKRSRKGIVRRALLAIESAEIELASTWRQQPRLLLIGFFLSAISWLALIFEYRLALQYLGLSLPWPQTIGVLTGARIAFLFPLPGGLGTLEASQVLAMQALGASTALGVSLSLLIRARDILFGGIGLALGGYWAWGREDSDSTRGRFARAYKRYD